MRDRYFLPYIWIFYVICNLVSQSDNIASSFDKNIHRANLSRYPNQIKLKIAVSNWWRSNSVHTHLQCKYRPKRLYKNKVLEVADPLEIASFPCEESILSLKYHFKGKVKDGYIQGTGKLFFFGKEEWEKLKRSDKRRKEAIMQKNENVCFNVSGFENRDVKSVVGAFKKGRLHGPTKIIYRDDSFSIGKYKNGVAHGYQRTFDKSGILSDAGGFDRGFETGFHWKRRVGHLIYQDRSMIKDKISPTVLFPIMSNGSLGHPLTGNYYPHAAALQDIQKIYIKSIQNKTSCCLIDITFGVLDKERHSYDLISATRYPLFGQKNHVSLCNISLPTTSMAPNYLEKWFISIGNLMGIEENEHTFTAKSPLQVLWRLKPETTRPDLETSTFLISDININNRKKTKTAKILGSPPVKIEFTGGGIQYDSNLNLHGFNDIHVLPEDIQYIPQDNTLSWSPSRIIGNFDHGNLNGLAIIKTDIGTEVWATVRNGVIHGPVIICGISYILERGKLDPIGYYRLQKGIGFIGYYKNSIATGNFWAGMIGGAPNGYLHGQINQEDGTITGSNIAYIYPDLETVLLGKFKDRIMKDGKESSLLGLECDENGLLFVNKYSAITKGSPSYYHESPSNITFGAGPKGVLDPYERKWLELKNATNPTMGQGVFAKRDLKKGVLASSYNGFVFGIRNGENHLYKQQCSMNITKSIVERRNCHAFSLPLPTRDGGIHIPPSVSDRFFPSLGPKVNHNFIQNNSVYVDIEHPRWGAIMGVQITKDVKSGEELFTYYGYKLTNTSLDFPWYWHEKNILDKR